MYEISLTELNGFSNRVGGEDANMFTLGGEQAIRGQLAQSKSEYINVKCYQSKYLIITTWSSIYLIDLFNGFKLLTSNYLYSIPNNNWSVPNKLYVSSKFGEVSLFDPSTSFLTFIWNIYSTVCYLTTKVKEDKLKIRKRAFFFLEKKTQYLLCFLLLITVCLCIYVIVY